MQIQNSTGNPIPVGGVVGLGDMVAALASDSEDSFPEFAFKGEIPTKQHVSKSRIGIMAERASSDEGFYWAYVDGIFPARVNFSSDDNTLARVNYEDPDNEALVAHSGYGEFRVMWRASGTYGDATQTGLQWALVTPIPMLPFLGYLKNDGGAAGTATAAATWTYTVKDQFGLELDTEVPLDRKRPVGTMNFAAEGSRGLVAYELGNDGPVLILLDAYGEYPGVIQGCGS